MKALEKGCNDFVRKPFRETEIFKMMLQHLGVRFVYKGEDDRFCPPPTTKQISTKDLDSLMATVPVGLLTKLVKAADSCDADRIDQIIDDIRIQNDHLGDALASLSAKFAYGEIFTLANKAKEL